MKRRAFGRIERQYDAVKLERSESVQPAKRFETLPIPNSYLEGAEEIDGRQADGSRTESSLDLGSSRDSC